MDHRIYDKRRYPIVDVREGYGKWVHTYEQTVQDEMDLRLLERLHSVDWSTPRFVLDLACGTGRIGAWLRTCSSAAIDGIDIRFLGTSLINDSTFKQHSELKRQLDKPFAWRDSCFC